MEVRKSVWTVSFIVLTLQILILQCTSLSAAHLKSMRSSKNATSNSGSLDDFSFNKQHPFREVRNKKQDENIKNEGLDMFNGKNRFYNTSLVRDCPPDYIDCPDTNTCCLKGWTCCPDSDGDGLMECCHIEYLDDLEVSLINGSLLKDIRLLFCIILFSF